MRFGDELKSISGQSVGEEHAGLQVVEKLAIPLANVVNSIPILFHLYIKEIQ